MICKQIILIVLFNLYLCKSWDFSHQNPWDYYEEPEIFTKINANRFKKEKLLLESYEKILKRISSEMKSHHGMPEFGVPQLDPFFLEDLSISENLGNAEFKLSKPNILGLSNFQIKRLEFENESLVLELFFPEIYVSLKASNFYKIKYIFLNF